MRKKYIRQQFVQVQLEIDEIQEAVLHWFPIGFAFVGLLLHIFPKITLPI
ncbi:MAG: hypothetical protein ACM3KE_12000 [Hyphomicrobiales bacterium]